MKLDLHVHTIYSVDARNTIDNLRSECKKKGIEGIAVTDHNTMKGIRHITEELKDELIIIPGEEISSKQGHIIALYIDREIKPGLDIYETIDLIKRYNGISILPHPYRMPHRITDMKVVEKVDLVEAMNGRSTKKENMHAFELSKRAKKSSTGGSDSHSPSMIGRCYTKIDDNNNSDIYSILKKGECFASGVPITYSEKIGLWTDMVTRWLARGGRSL